MTIKIAIQVGYSPLKYVPKPFETKASELTMILFCYPESFRSCWIIIVTVIYYALQKGCKLIFNIFLAEYTS